MCLSSHCCCTHQHALQRIEHTFPLLWSTLCMHVPLLSFSYCPCPCMQRVGDIIKQPSLLDPSTCAAAEGADPALLARLRNDINRCVRADRSYSPYSDAAKELAGEYRGMLCHVVGELVLVCLSAGDLRQSKFFAAISTQNANCVSSTAAGTCARSHVCSVGILHTP